MRTGVREAAPHIQLPTLLEPLQQRGGNVGEHARRGLQRRRIAHRHRRLLADRRAHGRESRRGLLGPLHALEPEHRAMLGERRFPHGDALLGLGAARLHRVAQRGVALRQRVPVALQRER